MPTTITLAEFRGTQGISAKNQVLADQTDANEKVGRLLAAANNPINEIRLTFRGNYLGAFDIVPSLGFYEWGIADASLKRQLALNGKRLICRQVSHQIDVEAGTLQTSAIFEVEAIGPDGIPGNYPTTYPTQTSNPPAPEWEEPFTPFTPVSLVVGNVGNLSICPLSSTSALFAYQDADDSFRLKCRVLDCSTGTLTAGTVNTVVSSTVGALQVVRLSDTSVLVVYENVSSSSRGEARVLTVSGGGDTITPGTAAIFDTEAHAVTVARWGTSSQHIVCYRDSGGGAGCVLAASGTVVAAYTPVTWAAFGGDTAFLGTATHVASGDAISVYYNTSSYACYGIILHDAAGTLTLSAEQDLSFNNTNTALNTHGVAAVSTNKVVVSNYDSGGYSRVLSISGDVITPGSPVAGGGFALAKVSSSVIFAGYPSPTNDDPATVGTFTVSGSSISADGNAQAASVADTNLVDCCYLSGGFGVLLYRESSTSDAYAVLVAGEPL